ncbi:hypothetical protein ACA910_012175 [Epithemia clementina (nom. ined.)]
MEQLDELRELMELAGNVEERRPGQAREDRYETRSLFEQAQGLVEPTLKFANIERITKEELAETKTAFLNTIWAAIHHDPEWLGAMRSKGIQNKDDIIVEEAIVEAEFRDNKVINKYAEQLAGAYTSQMFRQVTTLSTLIKLHIDQGYHNEALFDYLDREITPQNLVAMRVAAILKAREEANTEIKTVAVMESQAEQDIWWKNHITMQLTHTDRLGPIAVIKLAQLIATWKKHLLIETQNINVIQHVRMLKKVIQNIM